MVSLFVLCRLMIVLIWRVAACDCGNASSTAVDFPLIEGCIFNTVTLWILCLEKGLCNWNADLFFFFLNKSMQKWRICAGICLCHWWVTCNTHTTCLISCCGAGNQIPPPPQNQKRNQENYSQINPNISNYCWGWSLHTLYFYEPPPTKCVLMELHCGYFVVHCWLRVHVWIT